MAALHFLCSDGSRTLPPLGTHVHISLDNSALNLLTKPELRQNEPTAMLASSYVRGLRAEFGKITAGVAVVERHYRSRVPLREFPLKQALYNYQMTGKLYTMPNVHQVAYSASMTLCHIFGYVLCLLQAWQILKDVGGHDEQAKDRMLRFRAWAEDAPHFGGTTLVANGLYEALGKNVAARKAFKLSAASLTLADVLNAAWDLYQLQFMLNSAVDAARSEPPAIAVYMTRDQRLASVWSEYRVIDAASGTISVLGATNGSDPVLGPIARDGVRHTQERASTSQTYRKMLQQFPSAIARLCVDHADKVTARQLTRRCVELAGFLKQHPTFPDMSDEFSTDARSRIHLDTGSAGV